MQWWNLPLKVQDFVVDILNAGKYIYLTHRDMSDLLSGLSGRVTHCQELNEFVRDLKKQNNADITQTINKLDKMLNSDNFQYIDPGLIKLTKDLSATLIKRKPNPEEYKKQVSAFIDAILANKHLVKSNISIVKLAGSLRVSSVYSFQVWKEKYFQYQHKLREICKIFISFELQERDKKIKELLEEIERSTTLHFDVEDKLETVVYEEDDVFSKPETSTSSSHSKKRPIKHVLSRVKQAFKLKKEEGNVRKSYKSRKYWMTSEWISHFTNKKSINSSGRTRSQTNKISLSSAPKSYSSSISSESSQASSPAPPMGLKNISSLPMTMEEEISIQVQRKMQAPDSGLENKSDVASITSATGSQQTDSGYDSRSDAGSLIVQSEASPLSLIRSQFKKPPHVKVSEKSMMIKNSGFASTQKEYVSETQSVETTHDIKSHFHSNSIEIERSSLKPDTEKSGGDNAMEGNKPKYMFKKTIIGCKSEDTMVGIMKILEEIKDYESEVILDELEICGCELEKRHLEKLRDLDKTDCKISKLAVKNTTNIGELIPLCCEIFDKYKTSGLNLESVDLSDDNVEDLCKHLKENKRVKELNVSSNRNISKEGYEMIGCIVKEHEGKITNLSIADCNLTSNGLNALFSSIVDTELEGLDLSCSKKLKTYDFENIGKFVASNGVQRLKMSGCLLTEDAIWQLCKQNHPLDELDLSYNPAMEPDAYEALGSAAKACQVKKLDLSGCELNAENLAILKKSITGHKMRVINAGDNSSIASGIIEVGKIATNCELEEVDISDCMLVDDELSNFKKELYPERSISHKMLKRLSLGDYGRQLGQGYISEVCELLPQVEERLNLKFGILGKQCRSMLQKKLNQLGENGLQLYLNDEQMTTSTEKAAGSHLG